MRPEVSVVIPSHDRPLRLRWLLNALEDQTLDSDRFEVVVIHDSKTDETDLLLRAHPLTAARRLRFRRLDPGTGKPGHQRNIGWRMTEGPLIAFTDDDCRPEPEWLEALLMASQRAPGAIVQGKTRPDPFETDLLLAPHSRSMSVEPPGPFAQTCNILYPRVVLERTGGFVEDVQLASGEDTDLAMRSIAGGTELVGAPDAIVNHAVEALTLRGALRVTRKWSDLAYVVKQHPSVRSRLVARIFWRPSHLALLAALVGALLLPPRRSLVAIGPYLWLQTSGATGPRGILRSMLRLPGRVTIDGFELITCARGSIRHRTLFL
jgi:glycosyltransferase involved in cell wall biosynthesis